MKLRALTAIAFAAGMLVAGTAYAQQAAAPAAPPDLNAIPDKMPFNLPFGTPIGMDRAQGLVQAAVAEANKRGWPMNVAVVDPGGNLVPLHAWTARNSRRSPLPSIRRAPRRGIVVRRALFEDAVQKFGVQLCLDARRCDRFARRYSAGRGRQDHRRGRLLRRHRLAGRGDLHGRGRYDQQDSISFAVTCEVKCEGGSNAALVASQNRL